MNDKKICFIMCSNNEYYMQECLLYLSELIVPEGYEVDIVEVTGAKSMAAGYNEGMSKTDAKYKIYMHQDVFITNKSFLIDLLRIFSEDSSMGMIGMVGTPYLVRDAVMWNGVRFGSFYRLQEYLTVGKLRHFVPLTEGYLEVEAVDGMLMATQYDIPWREDIFQRWDFYDVSQCFEFLKAGYRIVVPGCYREWCIHDCGNPSFESYYKERDRFLEHYADFMEGREEQTWEEYLEQVRTRLSKGFCGTGEEKAHLQQLLEEMTEE